MSGIKLNFTDEEASSEARTYESLPTGEYVCAITKVETQQVKKEGENKGKPFWNVELTVQDGEYDKRKCWGTIMLFNGALYSLAQLLRATGYGNAIETGDIPSGNELEGKQLIVVGQKILDQYKMKKAGPGAAPEYKFDVKGYKSVEAGVGVNKHNVPSGGNASSLLP